MRIGSSVIARLVGSVVLLGGLIPALAGAPAAGATPPPYTWPEFHGSQALTGTSADPAVSTATAAQLGVKWMAPVGPSQGSPMVAWNADLGQTVIYDGTGSGYFDAINADTGAILWSDPFGKPVISSPVVDGNTVWMAPAGSLKIYKLNADTGAVECSAAVNHSVLSTPVVATPPGGQDTVYFAAVGVGPSDGLVYAFSAADCSQTFTWDGYTTPGLVTGVWDPLSYGLDATGEPLLVFGSANPDSSVYALDAVTGRQVWTFNTNDPGPTADWDVGAGVTLSRPGANGFADGVAYVVCKNGHAYALDLTTGAKLWDDPFNPSVNVPGVDGADAVSTPALADTTIVFGDRLNEYGVNALTGAPKWTSAGTDDINSSSLVTGAAGKRVDTYTTLGGLVKVLNLATGKLVYTYTTGGYLTSSPADYDGNIIVNSSDGYLYDFAVGGGNGASPSTAVTSPAAGAVVANPNGSLTVTGTATAPHGVSAVTVEVQQNPPSGQWLKGSTYQAGLAVNHATLATPGALSTKWTFKIPVPLQGAPFSLHASAVDSDGIADVTGAGTIAFSVAPSPKAPVVTVTPARVVPGGTVVLSAAKFAPNSPITFTVAGVTGPVTLATSTTSGTGTVSGLTAVVTSAVPFGKQLLTATDGSGRSGAGTVVVANNSPQLGYTSQRAGYEPYDNVLSSHQAVSSTTFLTPAWMHSTAGTMDTTPAITDGVEYVGDSAGHFYAIPTSTGVPFWDVSVGSAVESSPAVDGTQVFFGTDGGRVVALSTASGAQNWSIPLSGPVTGSPAVSGGVVYVASPSGTVYALSEAQGQSCGTPPCRLPSARPSPWIPATGWSSQWTTPATSGR